MEIMYNRTGKERKALVTAIAEITGVEAIYKGVPTCNYEVDYFTIDRNGTLIFDDSADSEEVEHLLEALLEKGFEAEVAKQTESQTEPTESEEMGLTIEMPATYFEGEALSNLSRIIEAKGRLIKKALGLKELPIIEKDEKISFPWFSITPEDEEETKAYTHLICSICEMARNQKRISAKDKPIENEKYAFRCFLLRLGFIGEEYKAERKILLRNLDGSSAFKGGTK
ncbi:MAG: virulence protein [Hespellia sp.]|nr:virulence protein [Hespellia sp.]